MVWQHIVKNRQGWLSEKMGLRYLKKQGMCLQAKNFACRYGEIDLIMLEKDTLVFIEVRFRTSSFFGTASESITSHKISRCRAAAEYYLIKHPQQQWRECRFDVLTIDCNPSTQKKELMWIKNAF